MRKPILEELALLPEREALARFYDHKNLSVLRKMSVILGQAALIGTVVFAVERDWVRLAFPGAALALLTAVLLGRNSSFLARNARSAVLVVLLVSFAAAIGTAGGARLVAYEFGAYCFPFLLIFFRFSGRIFLALNGLFLGTAMWSVWSPVGILSFGGTGPIANPEDRFGLTAGAVFAVVLLLVAALRLTRRVRRNFLEDWAHASMRERERHRMRTELSDAREIQLSMLPRAAPEVDWLEVANVSLPATEVGGDYFDYLKLSDSKVAVVVADVAGHGLASGLVLAAVRSGLYLLREDLNRPTLALRRLDEMIRETAPRRMFVTLQVALIDRALGRLKVASAGHPPVLHLPRDGAKPAPVGGAALPLGTRLPGSFDEAETPLRRGDVLIFRTDGVTEARNHQAEAYGDQRLLADAKRSVDGGSARAIRDDLLASLSHFRGDVEQEDDLTLLVARYLG